MKVSTEHLPQSQIALQIEVEDERLERAKDAAFKRLAKKVKVPGFRPGKVPRNILEHHLGEHAVLHEALDNLMPKVYEEALEQEGIDPIDRAEYDLVSEEPLVAKFTVPVRPTIDLGDYRELRVPKEPVVVDAERVQEGLESLRHRYATLEPAERPLAWHDVVRADVEATIDGAPFVKEDDAEFQLVEGRSVSLPGFAEALLGHAKGEALDFELPVPEDAPNETLRGKQARYRVTLKEIKQEVLPELDDEFARQVGEGFASLEELRARVENDLREALERDAEHRYHDAILNALVERIQPDYPPVLAERETERMLQEQSGVGQPASGRGAAAARDQLARYLQQVGRTEEELHQELRPIAHERICRSLVLSRVTEAEDIDVTESEIEAEIERLSSGAGDQQDELRRLFSSDSAKESLRRSLLTRKTLDRLVEIASGPEAEGDASETSAAQEG